ncbi:MAG: hypothetical protein J4N72_05995 [Chloroflexi bacterium]|nr:hypothetical protein [Chloroflexota bacterium]
MNSDVPPEVTRQMAKRATAVVVTFALAAVVLVSSLVYLSQRASAESSPEKPVSQSSDLQAESFEEQLVRKFAPILYLEEQTKPCGSGEAFDPGPVSLVLDQPGIFLREIAGDQPVVVESPGASDIFDRDDGYALDWPGNPRNPGCDYEEDYFALRGDDEPLIYAHIATEEGFDGFAVQYFFFYYYNDFLNKHEGDWEKIQLAFDAPSIEQALEQGPVRVAYSGHAGGEKADWDSGKLEKENGRPVVYVATGSHASYLEEGRYLGVAREGAVFGCEQTTGPHRRIDPAVQLLPDEATDPNEEFAWIEYEGIWGQYEKNGLYSGISGPKLARPWSEPFSWEASLRNWSEKLPEREALGFDPLGSFCFVVSLGSSLLNTVYQNPRTAGGGILVLLATAVGLLVVGVPQRTFGAKAQTRPDDYSPFVFQRHRNLGQIGRAGLVLYWRNWLLFAAIGAVFVALGTLASAIQGPLVISDLVDSPFAEPILVLTLGGLQAIISLLIIETSITVSLREMADGRSPSIPEVFRGAMASFWPVVRARLRASLYVIGLLITVVGTPWAIHRSVAWLFTEQMVILQGRRPSDALGASHALVNDRWFRSLGFIILAAVLLIVPATVIAVGMLLLLSPPTSDGIYVVNGLLYGLLLAPMFAISKVLFYFALRTPDEPTDSEETS